MIRRVYSDILSSHLTSNRQMAFVAGARQVGKTTTCRDLTTSPYYMNWDVDDDQRVIVAGVGAAAERLGLDRISAHRPIIVFDELHKYGRWKSFLKGFFDTHANDAAIVVTGSSRLDVYRRGGDSLMGRYFLYHLHPLSVAEIAAPTTPEAPVRPPVEIASEDFNALWTHGGFPEPFLKRDARFSRRWRRLRRQQLVREDIRDLTQVQHIDQIGLLADLLVDRSGSRLVYSTLANELRVSVDTIRRWIETLKSLHYGFTVRPWFRNVAKSLRKEPKWFLSDWAPVADPGQRAETFVACHLLKAVDAWNDIGLGEFALHYLRDVNKREVDLLVVRDDVPWVLVEVKTAPRSITPALSYFQKQLNAPHAFQVAIDTEYVEADCFEVQGPIGVSARTFLSQLV